MEDHHKHTNTKAEPANSYMQWVGICLSIGAVLLLAITVFKVPVNTLATGAIFLVCPLLHIMMMKNGNHKH